MRMSISILAILLTVLTAVPRVHAQTSHAATQAAIDAALQQHTSSTSADRADVLRVLDHPEVNAVAGRAGIDLRRAASAMLVLALGRQGPEVMNGRHQRDIAQVRDAHVRPVEQRHPPPKQRGQGELQVLHAEIGLWDAEDGPAACPAREAIDQIVGV